MSNKCRTTPKNTTCGVTVQDTGDKVTCEPFDECLGLGRRLHYNGECFSVTGGGNTPDGWYGQVQVVGNCIVAVRETTEPTYTPPPCAPNPAGCNDGGGSGGTVSCSELVDTSSRNLSRCSNGKLLTTVTFGGTGNVTVEGSGTTNDPFILTAPTGGGGISTVSSNTLSILGSGSLIDPLIINQKEVFPKSGTYAGFTIDEYGRIIGYDEPTSEVVKKIETPKGSGLESEDLTGVVSLKLAASGVSAGSYAFGGYTVKVNDAGQLANIEQSITLEQQTFAVGGKQYTINAQGSISAIKEVPPDTSGFATTFTAVFRGGAADDERSINFTMPLDGFIHVEYLGKVPNAQSGITTEGMRLSPQRVTITVDGIAVPDVMSQTGSGGTVIGLRGTTANAMAAGIHEVTITSTGITTEDAFIKVELVGRGG